MDAKRLGNQENYPVFEADKFSVLSSEFKQLYVGITRTRHDLYIIDEDTQVNWCYLFFIFIVFLLSL